MPTLKFTVDSALLEELGKRLVGKPHIALAELVKNSYDADATEVTIKIDPEKDRIVVYDNGHGMDFDEFKDFWMRIGSPHKSRQKVSRGLKRPLTGSKGVGRLAVQLLANELRLHTVSDKNPKKNLKASVKWEEAVTAGELTEAEMRYEEVVSEEGFNGGTSIFLKGLNHEWDKKSIEDLANEIWWLQPPFRSRLKSIKNRKKAFEIKFVSPQEDLTDAFNRRIRAVMDIWYAKLVGKNENGNVDLSLQFAGREPININYTINDCKLEHADFEIRIYLLEYRQPFGIKVDEAREYFIKFGGVHIYDGGFHLPYYGTPDNDWLKTEWEHSRRGGSSKLLPKEMQQNFDGFMMQVPTLRRLFGVVNVATAEEHDLHIMITRDRLAETPAFRNLVDTVRWAIHFYALEEEKWKIKKRAWKRETEPIIEKVEKVEEVLSKYREEIPEEIYERLHNDIRKTTIEIESNAEETLKQVSLFGSLATAGISSLAYQHELRKQFQTINGIIKKLEDVKVEDEALRNTLKELREDLSSWLDRAKSTNALFSYLADAENIEKRERFPAKKVIEEIRGQVKVLARGVPIKIDRIDESLYLPKASRAEWGSIFQNVFINAFNAMVDSEKKILEVSSRTKNNTRELLIQDTGVGVNLSEASSFFEPFVRKIVISPERRALGYGGQGLGLTIVDFLAKNIGCKTSFVEPEKGFNTAFSLSWREKR